MDELTMAQFFTNFQNLDLLSVGVAVAGMAILGFVTLFNDLKSISNRVLFYLSFSACAWGIVNYASYQLFSLDTSFLLLKLVMFFAVWASFFTFTLTYVFPSDKIKLSWYYKWFVVPLTVITAFLTLTPLVFLRVSEIGIDGHIAKVVNGPGIFLFAITIICLNIGGIISLIKKIYYSSQNERKPLKLVLFGMILMLTLIIVFNFILPAFLGNSRFIPLGALFMFPFIAFTAYAILKHKFFNIKVTGAALLVFTLSVITFGEIIFVDELFLIIYRSSIFILVLMFGILLIKSVLKEVEARELIEKQEKELKIANAQQVSLIHFITHQIKGFLTKSKYIFSEMLEGDYGVIPDPMKVLATEGLKSGNEGVDMVQSILNAANLKRGTVKYKMIKFDIRPLVSDVVLSEKKNAEAKGLTLEADIPGNDIVVFGDHEKLDQVFKNLIDNAIKYTLNGNVKVSLSKSDGKIMFSVKDSGVGISSEDKTKLFTEGGKGKNSMKVNVNSTGYGLFIAKAIAEAHTGKIWAESAGEGKGSTFSVELPVAS